MDKNKRFDDKVSRWLEEAAPARLPERVLNATFERTLKSRQHVGWRGLMRKVHLSDFAFAAGAAAVVVIVAALAAGLYVNRAGVGGPNSEFVGTWKATDPPPESSHLMMDVTAKLDGTYRVVIHDDSAAVCDGVPSTMTGVAEARKPGMFVIAQPDFHCDDDSQPHALSGPPLAEQLRDYTLIYDVERDQLRDLLGLVWSRATTDQ